MDASHASVHRLRASAEHPDELAQAAELAANLRKALVTSRCIGMAVGTLKERHKVTAEAAFTILADASNRQNRRVRDLADAAVAYGAFDIPPQPA